MPVTFACSCGKKYSAPDDAAGKQTKCKACGATVKIPGAKPGGQAPAARKPQTARVAAPPKPAPKPDDLDFADSGPPAAKPDELFQGPPPSEASPEAQRAGPAAALYGQTPGEGAPKKDAKQVSIVPWLVILGIVAAGAAVLKFVLLK